MKDGGRTWWEFNWDKWRQWAAANGHGWWANPDDKQFEQKRMVKTRLGGWRYGSFCKTQYASDPACGGVPNFIWCHLSVIHLLDKIAELPTMKVEIDDEGHYGRSYYTDDPSADERVYTWHEGEYNVQALIKEVGEWNEMVAAMFGGLSDLIKAKGGSLEGPIKAFPNFEQLEFKGQNPEHLGPFLEAMRDLAKEEVKA